MKNETISPYSAPGIGLDEKVIIDMITKEFDMPDISWVRSKSRITNEKIARQLLWKCLIDHLKYTQREAGMVSLKTGCNALHGTRLIESTFWNDPQYGDKIKFVYYRCIEIKKKIFV